MWIMHARGVGVAEMGIGRRVQGLRLWMMMGGGGGIIGDGGVLI